MSINSGKGGTDFSTGSLRGHMLRQAIPLAFAQLVQLLYNIVDRIYIGHMPVHGALALTGLGITFPFISMIAAFTNLYGTGAMPLFSMSRGAGDDKRAAHILGNTFLLLICTSAALMAVAYTFLRPLLYLCGASEESYAYAEGYMRIYLLGTPLTMLATGLNGMINAQGFPVIGMMTVVLGAITNLILDPVLIYTLELGVTGAALATVISQSISCMWVLLFLTGVGRRKPPITLRKDMMRMEGKTVRSIMTLGLSGFMMSATNGFVQAACSSTLQLFGGDLYVSIFTVFTSVREVVQMPVSGLTSGSQPVLGYNYGAKVYSRVRKGIRTMAGMGMLYAAGVWVLIMLFPSLWIQLFSDDGALLEIGISCMRVYFSAFFFMTFQFAGQTVFQGLGLARYAIFFSILRKIVIVMPLTLLLPRLGLGVMGVFLAEPVSDVLGGCACMFTMIAVIYHPMKEWTDGQEVQIDGRPHFSLLARKQR